MTFAVLGMTATPASAYVRKRTDGGIDEYWQVSCISMTIDENAVPPVPAYDARNTVLFYTPDRPYPDNSGLSWEVVALTAGWARADGHIVDADVRINAYDNQFANLDPNFVPPADGNTPYDLQNAVTHEFGHVLGLGHSCWTIFSDLEQPVDDKDAAVPTCDPSAPIAVQSLDYRAVGFSTPIIGVIGADILDRYVVTLDFSPCRGVNRPVPIWKPHRDPCRSRTRYPGIGRTAAAYERVPSSAA